MLEHMISTLLKHTRRLTKILGYDFEICYKKGVKNKVVDTLSRVTEPELLTLTVSSISIELLEGLNGGT